MTDETAVLDPAEFIDGRIEFDMRKDGIDIVEVDYGDAEMEKFYIKQALGEVPADSHPPNRKVTMKLQARDDDPNYPTLAEVAYRLQLKVGTLAEKGGWIRRDMNSTQGFAVSVGAQVHNAVLGGLHGWFMSHRGIANEVTLVLTIGSYFYGTEEFATAVVKQEAGRYIEYTRENIRSTVKGLSRIQAKNLNENATWRAVIWAEECDTAPDDLTNPRAKLRYAPSELEIIGEAAASAALKGGGKAVTSGALSATTWSSIVHSLVIGKGHMIHRGNRRLWVRANGTAGTIGVRIIWRPLGTTRWNERNKYVTFTGGSSHLLDLGEMRAVAPALGEERIEFIIQAYSPTGSQIILEDIFPLPLEQYIVLTDSEEAAPPTNKIIKVPGAGESKQKLKVYNPSAGNALQELTTGEAIYYGYEPFYAAIAPGVAWSNPNNIKLQDSSWAISSPSLREGTPGGGYSTAWLLATKFGFALPATAIVSQAVVTTTGRFLNNGSTGVVTMYHILTTLAYKGQGRSILAKGGSSYPYQTYDTSIAFSFEGDAIKNGGGILVGSEVNDETFGAAVAMMMGYTSGNAPYANMETNVITIGLYYSENESEALCYQQRSIELRSEGCYRQHKNEEVWGEVVPQGNFPYAPVGGLEAKPSRGILIPSQGDLTTPDIGENSMQIQAIERPAYQFTSEAI